MAYKLKKQRNFHIDVSIIIPVLNEEDNVIPLCQELMKVLSEAPWTYEVIFVDDGSSDRTVERLRTVSTDDRSIIIIEFTKRFGQTAALVAGFDRAQGRVLVPMDGDRQNDPHDIPKLVAKLNEPPGWDIVSGWRKNRKDNMMRRRLPSVIANRLVRRLTWTNEVHDFGCTLKAYRYEVLEDVHLFGEMHRFLPAICKWRGAQITEMIVNHRPRIAGKTKYDLRRTVKVMLDVVTVKFFGDYLTKPIYFFGKLSLLTFSGSLISFGVALFQKFGYLYGGPNEYLNMNRNVLVLLAMMLFMMTVVFVMMGVMSELMVRIYHETRALPPYKIRRVIRDTAEAAVELPCVPNLNSDLSEDLA